MTFLGDEKYWYWPRDIKSTGTMYYWCYCGCKVLKILFLYSYIYHLGDIVNFCINLSALWPCWWQWISTFDSSSRGWWWSMGYDALLWWQHTWSFIRQFSGQIICIIYVGKNMDMSFPYLRIKCYIAVCQLYRDNGKEYGTTAKRGCICIGSINGDSKPI